MSLPLRRLLGDGPIAITLGVRDFADALRSQGAPVEEVDWRPPHTPDQHMAQLLARLL